jgi:hypothetical protein
MNIDNIEAGWGEEVIIWVRPAAGMTWKDVDTSGIGVRSDRSWQPARLNGFVESDSRVYYGTGLDSRRVWLLGSQYAFNVKKFEFGDVIPVPFPVDNTADMEVESTPSPAL